MDQSGGSERLTAFVSTLVAIAILAAGVTAHQHSTPEVTDATQLGSDLRFQLEMSFRHDTRERDLRLSRLDEVMAAWQKSPQSETDREALMSWLREAGARSLPGALRVLPKTPEFSTPQPLVEHTVQKVPGVQGAPQVTQTPVNKTTKPEKEEFATARPRLLTQAPTEQPVTPTPADPLEEEMIELRQPPSLDPIAGAVQQAKAREIAPRPGPPSETSVREKNLLASVPVAAKNVPEEVGVNLTELAARIAGYHDGLDEVELALLRMENPDLTVVTEQINRLDSMTRDYGFVDLYYQSLTDAEQKSVIAPRSMRATLDEVERQLSRCEEVRDGDFLSSVDETTKSDIAALRARLAKIGKRVGE
jgi:hypothetical protein